jgi:hypothetical protein
VVGDREMGSNTVAMRKRRGSGINDLTLPFSESIPGQKRSVFICNGQLEPDVR